MIKTSGKAWEQAGWRRWHEKREDGSTWEVTEHAKTADCVLLGEYFRAARLAMERGEPSPSVPPLSEVVGPGEVVCVERTERRVGGFWQESDGQIYWESESGMVYGCDANGRPIVDPSFRNKDPAGLDS
jgi:hypothetical protein